MGKGAIQTHQGVSTSPIDIDPLMFSAPISFIALSYKKLRAYGTTSESMMNRLIY
jgi:hypothetical protein